MTDCVFTIKDNQLTTVSGSDAGTFVIRDNFADIKVSGVTYHRNPFDLTISKVNSDGTITVGVI